MMNCLSTLGSLIDEDAERAAAFTLNLADVHRYILRNRDQELVGFRTRLHS